MAYRVFVLILVAGILFINAVPVTSQNIDEITTANVDPAWSPDGLQIAFASSHSGNYDIWLYDFGDDTISNLTPNSEPDEGTPVWLPDNETIVYVSVGSEDSDIYKLNTKTHELENLTQTPLVREFSPAISNDGRYLAFASRTKQRQDIVILDLETRILTNLTGHEESIYRIGMRKMICWFSQVILLLKQQICG